MAMTKTLWSINALATEFNLDRRTVAKRIDHIRPATRDGEPKQWYLSDVASALANQPPARQQHRGGFVDDVADRLAHWEDIQCSPKIEMSLPDFAQLIGRDEQTMLARLRAGCPFRRLGDWHTGEGFTVETPYAIDWSIMMTILVRLSDRTDLAEELGL